MQFHLHLIYTELKTQILFPMGNVEYAVAEWLVSSLFAQTYQFINSLVFFPPFLHSQQSKSKYRRKQTVSPKS